MSYIICLFIFCLVIPSVIIVYLYGKLLCLTRQVSGCPSCLFTVTPSRKQWLLLSTFLTSLLSNVLLALETGSPVVTILVTGFSLPEL